MVRSGFFIPFKCILKPPKGNDRGMEGEFGKTKGVGIFRGDLGG